VMAVAFEHLDELDEELGAGSGEELVERLALVLRAHVRERDVVARVGDARLCVLLDRVASEEGRRVVQRLFQLVRQRAALGHGAVVECGLGMAPLSAQSELTAEQALLKAERSSEAQSDLRNSTRSLISFVVRPSGATAESSL
jgi:diguanylate cyclase (GGDEF)-like protein